MKHVSELIKALCAEAHDTNSSDQLREIERKLDRIELFLRKIVGVPYAVDDADIYYAVLNDLDEQAAAAETASAYASNQASLIDYEHSDNSYEDQVRGDYYHAQIGNKN